MTGRSLLPILRSGKSGQVDPARTSVLSGMERHVVSRPARAIRTAGFLYIRNLARRAGQGSKPRNPCLESTTPRASGWRTLKGFRGPGAVADAAIPVRPPRPTGGETVLCPSHRRARGGTLRLGGRPCTASQRRGRTAICAGPCRIAPGWQPSCASGDPRFAMAAPAFDTRLMAGWTVQISLDLLARDAEATARCASHFSRRSSRRSSASCPRRR